MPSFMRSAKPCLFKSRPVKDVSFEGLDQRLLLAILDFGVAERYQMARLMQAVESPPNGNG